MNNFTKNPKNQVQNIERIVQCFPPKHAKKVTRQKLQKLSKA